MTRPSSAVRQSCARTRPISGMAMPAPSTENELEDSPGRRRSRAAGRRSPADRALGPQAEGGCVARHRAAASAAKAGDAEETEQFMTQSAQICSRGLFSIAPWLTNRECKPVGRGGPPLFNPPATLIAQYSVRSA